MEKQNRAKRCAPSFDVTSVPGPIEAVIGESLTITLKVKGNPRPQVRWQIGKRKVKETSNKYRVDQSDRGLCTLVINKSCKILEEGVWAIATNDIGEDCCMIEVRVREKEYSHDENDTPVFNLKRTEENTRTRQFSQRRENKTETENASQKSGVVFGLGAKQKRNFSLSKSFDLDEGIKDKKPGKIDRSMIGEFNFFHETPAKKSDPPAKSLKETTPTSSLNSRPLHKPPPLPARFKNDSKSGTTTTSDKPRTQQQNRWKKGSFGSHNFVATSSEVELNDDEDDDEEPVEPVRITKRKRKTRMSSVNASFESSRSSVNSVCLETNFDDCDPKLTEEKDSWHLETEFSSNFVPNASTKNDKQEPEVASQTNKLPARQENGEAWLMDGVKINRVCHDMLSTLPEIDLIDYRKINKTQEVVGSSSTSSSRVSDDFEMENYATSPKRRQSMNSSLIKLSNDNLSAEKISNALKEPLVRGGSQGELKIEKVTPSPYEVNVRASSSTEEEEEEEEDESSSSSSSSDDDDDDDEKKDEKVEDGKVEEAKTEEEAITARILTEEGRPEVTTDDDDDDDGDDDDDDDEVVDVDESVHFNSSEKENELENKTESRENEIESQESSTEIETSDESDEEQDISVDNKTNSLDANNNNKDDSNNNNNNNDDDDDDDDYDDDDDDSSVVKSTPLQFIDSEASDEEWPAPPSAEILNSLLSLHSPNLMSNNININNNNNNSNNNNLNNSNNSNNSNNGHKVTPIQIRLSPNKSADKENAIQTTKLDQNKNPKVDLQSFKTHKDSTALPAYNLHQQSKIPTYREAIFERAGTFGLTSSVAGLRGFSPDQGYKKVAFRLDQSDGKAGDEKVVTSEYKSINPPNKTISSVDSEPRVDSKLIHRTTFSKDKAMFFNSIAAPIQSKDAKLHINHVENQKSDQNDKIERRSGEKKSVRFVENDSSGNEAQERKAFVKPFQPQTRIHTRSGLESYTAPRWHDSETKHFIPSDRSSQINGEKQTKRFAFDERDGKKESFEDGMTSPATLHEYGELISFGGRRRDGGFGGKTMEELTEETINEVVTSRCSVREAVRNILKNRADRRSPNLWSHNDGDNRVRLPHNLETRLENYPTFLSGLGARRLEREAASPGTPLHPGIRNAKIPEPHFV